MVRATAVVALGGVLVVGLLAWRLARGPIPLDFLVPRLEAALSDGVTVGIGAAELAWDGRYHRLVLRGHDVRLGRAGAGSTLALADVVLRLQSRALLVGHVVVTAIEALEPRLEVVRTRDGGVSLGAPSAGSGVPDLDAASTMLARVRSVSIRNGELTLVDEVVGGRWTLPRVDATIRREGGLVRAELDADVAVDPARIPLRAEATFDEHERRFFLRATSDTAATDDVLRAWPPGFAPEAQRWVVTHVAGGAVRDLRVELDGHAGTVPSAVETLAATLAFDGVSVRYLDTMPRVTAVRGTGAFSLQGADFTVTGAALDAVAVEPARVHLAWGDDRPPRLAIEASVAGPLAAVVGVLDYEPIALAGLLGIQTRGMEGHVTGRLGFDFPLGGRPTLATLGLTASATVRDAAVPALPGGWSMTEGTLEVTADGRGVTTRGRVRLDDVAVEMHGVHPFDDPTARHLEIAGRLEHGDLVAFGLDPGTALDGPIDAVVQFGQGAEGRDVADVELDLGAAELHVPALALRKAPSVPGRVTARLGLARGVVAAVERFELVVGETSIRANGSRSPAGGLWSKVDIEATFAPAAPDGVPGEAALTLRADGDRWRVTVGSKNVGHLLESYGNSHGRGGVLSFEGMLDPTVPGLAVDGQVTIEDVTLVGAPWIVRVVTLASLQGLLGGTSNQSIGFNQVTTSVSHRAPVLTISAARARGAKLSVAFRGTADLVADTLDLEGTLIPSYYRLNEAPGRIPIVGEVLARATGGAIQAVNFTVRGSRDDPQVAVKTLSSLAPGALRDLLQKLGL